MKELYKALAGFQQACPIIHKGTEGYGYSYASFDHIVKTINPFMKRYGLGFTQLIESTVGRNYVKTIIFHIESGESLESAVLVPDDVQLKGMNKFQVDGSSFTYYKRYGLSSILGIITDKDIDCCGTQLADNGIKDARIDPFAEGRELEDQLKKAILSISLKTEPKAPATFDDFAQMGEIELREVFESYKQQELDFNAKIWISEQMTKPKKSGSIDALNKLWQEAVKQGFDNAYVKSKFTERKEEILKGENVHE